MKSKINLWTVAFTSITVIGIFVGCASFNAATYQTENLAADAATSATHAFNTYSAQNLPTASAADAAKIKSAQATIYDADKKFAATLAVVEQLRAEYATNSANTNQVAIQVSLQSLEDQSSNIVALVKLFMNSGGSNSAP